MIDEPCPITTRKPKVRISDACISCGIPAVNDGLCNPCRRYTYVVQSTRYLVTETYWLDLRSGEATLRGSVRTVTDYKNTHAMKRAMVANNKNRARMGQCKIAVCKDSLIMLENDAHFGIVSLKRAYVI